MNYKLANGGTARYKLPDNYSITASRRSFVWFSIVGQIRFHSARRGDAPMKSNRLYTTLCTLSSFLLSAGSFHYAKSVKFEYFREIEMFSMDISYISLKRVSRMGRVRN